MIFASIPVDRIIGFSSEYFDGSFYAFCIACIICIVIAIVVGIKARNYSSQKQLTKLNKRIIVFSEKVKIEAKKYEELKVQREQVTNNEKSVLKIQSLVDKQFRKLEKLNYEVNEIQYDIDNFPYAKPRGFYNFFEMYVEFVESNVLENMDYRFEKFTGYIVGLSMFMLVSFIIGIMGFPSPFGTWSGTLTISIATFIGIYISGFHFKGIKELHKFIEPMPFFLPINLLSMWSPLISLSLRLFGNVLAGWCISTLLYTALAIPIGGVNVPILAPLIMPFIHAYFDVFSGTIQTLVFCLLSMLFIVQEAPEVETSKIKMGSELRTSNI